MHSTKAVGRSICSTKSREHYCSWLSPTRNLNLAHCNAHDGSVVGHGDACRGQPTVTRVASGSQNYLSLSPLLLLRSAHSPCRNPQRTNSAFSASISVRCHESTADSTKLERRPRPICVRAHAQIHRTLPASIAWSIDGRLNFERLCNLIFSRSAGSSAPALGVMPLRLSRRCISSSSATAMHSAKTSSCNASSAGVRAISPSLPSPLMPRQRVDPATMVSRAGIILTSVARRRLASVWTQLRDKVFGPQPTRGAQRIDRRVQNSLRPVAARNCVTSRKHSCTKTFLHENIPA
eukprot:SAG11_NODE_1177_length_5600_cov_2.043447_2_plen_293_part_00